MTRIVENMQIFPIFEGNWLNFVEITSLSPKINFDAFKVNKIAFLRGFRIFEKLTKFSIFGNF